MILDEASEKRPQESGPDDDVRGRVPQILSPEPAIFGFWAPIACFVAMRGIHPTINDCSKTKS